MTSIITKKINRFERKCDLCNTVVTRSNRVSYTICFTCKSKKNKENTKKWLLKRQSELSELTGLSGLSSGGITPIQKGMTLKEIVTDLKRS